MPKQLFLLAAFIVVAGCPGETPTSPTRFTVDGRWNAAVVGSFTPGGSGVMSLTLSQNGTTVTGNGTFTDSADPPTAIMTVTGSVNGSSVALTLQVQPQQYMGRTVDANQAPMQFSGTLTATTMKGALNGGGPPPFTALTANFTKQ